MGGRRPRTPPFRRRRPYAAAPWVLALSAACGRGTSTEAAPQGTTAAAPSGPGAGGERGEGPRDGSGGAALGDGAPSVPRAATGGAPAPSGSGGAAGETALRPEADPAVPCRVTWEGGPHLRFTPTGAGGSIHVDLDADGARDLCATFKAMAARDEAAAGPEGAPPSSAPIGYLRIDQGCDRKAETIVRVEPAGHGLFRTVTRAGEAVTVAALVPLPFAGSAAPGYVLDRSPGAYNVTSSCGRVVRVQAKAPPATEVTFGYHPDPCGAGARLSEIRHDEDGDGTPEWVLAYHYDGDGRLTEIAETRGAATRRARVRGTCR